MALETEPSRTELWLYAQELENSTQSLNPSASKRLGLHDQDSIRREPFQKHLELSPVLAALDIPPIEYSIVAPSAFQAVTVVVDPVRDGALHRIANQIERLRC